MIKDALANSRKWSANGPYRHRKAGIRTNATLKSGDFNGSRFINSIGQFQPKVLAFNGKKGFVFFMA
jgi:hypothetical protein